MRLRVHATFALGLRLQHFLRSYSLSRDFFQVAYILPFSPLLAFLQEKREQMFLRLVYIS